MKMTKIYKRPNTTVSWWVDMIPQNVKDRMKSNFIDTGYLLSEEFIYSDDGLTLTWKQEWSDQQGVMGQFINDEVLSQWRVDRETYCQENGIESGMTYMEFVTDGVNYAGYWEDGSIKPVDPF
jgi:hypothetical protein